MTILGFPPKGRSQVWGHGVWWAGCGLIWTIVISTAYLDGYYGYHDLGLITEFLTSWWYGLAPSGLTDPALSHLLPGQGHFAAHFNPTVFLLSPLLLLANSAWLFLFLQMAAFFCGGLLLFRLLMESQPGRHPAPWIIATTIAALSFNRYARGIILSGHFEVFYFPLAMGCILAIVRGARLWMVLGLWLLAMGVRQDMGLYFAFHLLLAYCLFRQHVQVRRPNRLFILLAGLSLLYTAGVSLLMSQWFGTPRIDPLAAAWGHLGSNWPEVAATMLSQPLSTLSAIGSSAGWAIVLSFGIACISKPGLTVIALVPAGLLLVASEPFKHQLWYYNSSMVWPGLAWIAGAQIFQWSISDQPRHRWLGRACAISALAAALWNVNQVPSGDHGFKLHSKLRGLSATKAIHIGEKNCPGIRSWTAGFRGNVYLPLRKPRFHLHRWPEADALLEWEHDRELAHPQPPRPVDWQSLDWSQHVKVAQVKGAAVWVRRDRVDEACTAAESDESSISEPGD